eukprot:gene15266-16841_t
MGRFGSFFVVACFLVFSWSIPSEGYVVPKAGECPVRSGLSLCTGDECTNDYMCPGAQKCCNHGCRLYCADPVTSYGMSVCLAFSGAPSQSSPARLPPQRSPLSKVSIKSEQQPRSRFSDVSFGRMY